MSIREILFKVECYLCIVIFKKYGNKICILSMLARQVHVVYANMNQSLFLNIASTRKMCKFSTKQLWFDQEIYSKCGERRAF